MANLSSLDKGRIAVINKLSGGQHFISRVSAMGFTPDTPVEMIQNSGRGPILVFLHDTFVALGRGEASKILIKNEEAK